MCCCWITISAALASASRYSCRTDRSTAPSSIRQMHRSRSGEWSGRFKPPTSTFLSMETPSGTTLLEIYPEKDALYEIRSREIGGDQLPTRLRLYRDAAASSRREYVRAHRAWEIGLEFAGGWHSGFAQSSTAPAVGAAQIGGSDVEGC